MSLVNTRIQNIRANSAIDRYELRPSKYGAIDAFMAMTDDPNGIITQELKEKARLSIGSILETPVLNYDADITIGNTRTLTIADSENTSAMYQISFSTYSWGFTVTPSLYMNNEIGIQRDFERKFLKYLYKFAETLDTAALAALAAAKTQVIKDSLIYDKTGNSVNAGWNDRENIMGDLDVIMGSNDFYNQIHVVGNGGVESLLKKLQQKGLYNEVNKQNEFGTKIVHLTNNLSNAEGKYATGYAVNAGSLGILTRFERDCLLGTRSGDGHEWSIDTLPILGMPVGTYFYDSVGDYSALAGAASADMVRTRKEHYGFAVDVAMLTPYNSDRATIASPILAFNIAKGDTYAAPVYIANSEANPIPTKEVVIP